MNSQRTLSGLVTGDFDELVVENDFQMSGAFKAGTVQVQGDVTCDDINCTDIVALGDISCDELESASLLVGSLGRGLDASGALTVLSVSATTIGASHVSVGEGIATINAAGAILGTSVSAGQGTIETGGSIQGGAITGASLDTGAGTIQSTGTISGGTIQTTGTVSCASLDTGAGTIQSTGTVSGGTISGGTIQTTGTVSCALLTSTGGVSCTALQTGGQETVSSTGVFTGSAVSVTGQAQAGSLDLASSTPTLTTSIQGALVACSNLNLLDASNRVLPTGVYYVSGYHYLALNSAGWRPNDDHSYYNIHVEDDEANDKVFGRVRVASSVVELVQVVQVPQNWRATGVLVDVCDTAGSALIRNINAYRIANYSSVGFADLGNGTTDNEMTLSTVSGYMDGSSYFSLMIVLHTTSTSDYAAGGYVKLSYITDDY